MAQNYSDRLDGYVDVAERIRLFRERYPEGSLQPANLAAPWEIVTVGERTFLVYPNYDAILGYNCAHYYALSVALLADRLN